MPSPVYWSLDWRRLAPDAAPSEDTLAEDCVLVCAYGSPGQSISILWDSFEERFLRCVRTPLSLEWYYADIPNAQHLAQPVRL